METVDKLKDILENQQSKIRNRFFYSLLLLTIPLVVLVVNIMSITMNTLENPTTVVIFIFVLVAITSFAILENIIKNAIGWRAVIKLRMYLKQKEMYVTEINEFKTYTFFYNSLYKQINRLLQEITKNDYFTEIQNKRSLKYLNIKWAFATISVFILSAVLLIAEFSYEPNNINDWAVILGIVILILGWLFVFWWMIPRQIDANVRYKKFRAGAINEYEYNFSKPWLLLREVTEKLED